MQLTLGFVPVENPAPEGGAESEKRVDQSPLTAHEVVKAKVRRGTAYSARMEEVVEGLYEAFEKVAANKGAPGPDGKTIEQIRNCLHPEIRQIAIDLRAGTYVPGPVRYKPIPKPGGGERGLGIPNVVDRMVQEAVRRVLEPVYEPLFHPQSHGFRPNRGCQTAIAKARSYVEEGYHIVVDMDLEKFFDRVHHQRLMSKLAEQVTDRRVLTLIGKMLKAGAIMPSGMKVVSEEGVPQGGPLSPLLSNVVLNELDWELERRGHRFVRYADDCNVYVRSERAGHRVLASIAQFIEKRLRLQLNMAKSAVARPETRHFLGYRLHPQADGSVEVLLSERSKTRLGKRIAELTPRSKGVSLDEIILRINRYLSGWMGHFRVCTSGIKKIIRNADSHIRRRLRAFILKQWKRRRTIVRNLIRLGVRGPTAWKRIYANRKSIWALSIDWAVNMGLRNVFFADKGLKSLTKRFESIWKAQENVRASGQLSLDTMWS